ncbi:MAG: pyridoxal phosphate-dependent aminotransferase family protein [Candidatus Cloacimonadia bacterium]
MGILDKCYSFVDADHVRQLGFYPYFRVITSEQDTEVLVNGKKMLMLGSNSYLGLTNHPRVKEAAIKAIEKYGSGCAGSRFLNGTLDIHIELEEALAKLVGKEGALVFATGYQANLGAIASIVGRNEYVITDKYDHASIIDGARLSYGEMLRYAHNDMSSLKRALEKIGGANALVVVDGIFSMEGDIADLPNIITLCEEYGASLMVDEAHSLGVLHSSGAGAAKHFDIVDRTDIIMGTFSKSLASVGGFVAADAKVIDYMKHFARSLIFSASLPPASAASVLEALKIMAEEPERIEKLWQNTHFMMNSFKEMGYDTGVSTTPVIPLHTGDMMTTFKMWKQLADEGVFVNPVVPPAVPPNSCLIRCSFMATHTKEQLEFGLDKFKKIGKELDVI